MNVKEFMAVIAVILLGGVIFSLVRGIQAEEPAAFMVVGGLIALALAGLGGAGVLGVMWIASKWESRRARQEQEQFALNAKENLAVMRSMANAQAAQSRSWQTMQRALPAPGDALDLDALAYDEAVFSELEE
jgi:hypothetical protein